MMKWLPVILLLILVGCAGQQQYWTYDKDAAIRLEIEVACLQFQDWKWEKQKEYLMQQARGEITMEDYNQLMKHIDTIIETEKTQIYREFGLEYKPKGDK